VQRLPPLAQRLATDFGTAARFDNPRAVQIRLPGFTLDSLLEVGRRVRDLYGEGSAASDRVAALVDDSYLTDLAAAVTGTLGQKVGVAPRLYIKKLVGDVLDRVDQYSDFDPRRDYTLTVADNELTDIERNAIAATDVNEIDLAIDS
jgi:hypothetical protein